MLTPFITIVLIGWIPVSALLFAVFQPVQALTLAYLVGWLALPMYRIPIQGFLDIDKVMATNLGVILGVALFWHRRIGEYKANAADGLLVVFAISTCVTSLVNGLGAHDGLSSFAHKILYIAVPFGFGRVFIRDGRDLIQSSRIVIYGAAIYAVAAIWEWRMSPNIHLTLYGFFQHAWGQHYRWGFFRPIVCFPHALGLGVFMAWTSLLAVWLWRHKQFRAPFGIPSAAVVALPLVGLLTSMSAGPWALFLGGLGLLVWWQRSHRRWIVLLPTLAALAWMVGRYTELTDGAWMTSAVARVSAERAASLEYRIDAETKLLGRAKQRPVFGWGGWGRNRVTNEAGRDLAATDGLWIAFIGSFGLMGLSIFYAWWCWPLLMCQNSGRWLERDPALMAVLITIGLQAVNFLFNGFLSPILTVLCGGAVTRLGSLQREALARRRWVAAGAAAHGPAPYIGQSR